MDFKQSINTTCQLWNTQSFCHLPVTPKLINSYNCDGCEFDIVKCDKISALQSNQGVWLSIKVSTKTKFNLESYFKNITLFDPKTGKKSHPTMVNCTSGADGSVNIEFFGPNFIAKKLEGSFNKQLDVFLIFKEAKIGDQIYIDDLIQAEIVK